MTDSSSSPNVGDPQNHAFVQIGRRCYLLASHDQVEYLCKGNRRQSFITTVSDICRNAECSYSWQGLWPPMLVKTRKQIVAEGAANTGSASLASIQAWWTICFGEVLPFGDVATGKSMNTERGT